MLLASPEPPPTVVIIDDSRANLIAMEGLLQRLGYDLFLADNAEDGLRRALASEVALILADVRMPGIDGLEMLAQLRQRAGDAKTPVVFISGYAYDSEQARRAYELGALDYILKPIDPDILRAKISALVTLFQQAREIARRDRYIGILGHDLRNPLSAIKMGLHLLMKSPALLEEERGKLSRMSSSADRMLTMIGDLLDYTRSSTGKFPHHPVETDLRSVCDAAVEELRAVHPGRTIVLDVRGDVTGDWDPDRLQQVVSNLVGNALEYSTATVSVRVEAAEHDVVLTVHNDGDPISPEVLPVLFEPFRRGDQKPNGLGLGLYIVREVIRCHGGTIDVRSSATSGTTFVSRWPRRAPTAVRSGEDLASVLDSVV